MIYIWKWLSFLSICDNKSTSTKSKIKSNKQKTATMRWFGHLGLKGFPTDTGTQVWAQILGKGTLPAARCLSHTCPKRRWKGGPVILEWEASFSGQTPFPHIGCLVATQRRLRAFSLESLVITGRKCPAGQQSWDSSSRWMVFRVSSPSRLPRVNVWGSVPQDCLRSKPEHANFCSLKCKGAIGWVRSGQSPATPAVSVDRCLPVPPF